MIYLKYLLCAHGNVPEKKEISQNPLRNIMKQQERVRRGGERQKLSLLFMSKLEWTEGGCRWEMLIWMRDDRYSSESHNRRQARWLMSRWKKTLHIQWVGDGWEAEKKPNSWADDGSSRPVWCPTCPKHANSHVMVIAGDGLHLTSIPSGLQFHWCTLHEARTYFFLQVFIFLFLTATTSLSRIDGS